MKRKLFLFLLIAIAIIAISAEEQLSQQLTKADITHFIKDFPKLSKELDAINAVIDEDSGNFYSENPEISEKEIEKIIKKYGWNEKSIEKISIIIKCYVSIELKDKSNAISPEIEAQINEIKNNPYMPQEQKDQMIALITSMTSTIGNAFEEELNKKDIALVKQYIIKLRPILSSMFDN